MATIKFDAQEQAILIKNFEDGMDSIQAKIRQLTNVVDMLEGYQSKHKAQLMAKVDEVRANIKKSVEVMGEEQAVIKAKRQYLIESEATNPFASIDVAANTTTVADVF